MFITYSQSANILLERVAGHCENYIAAISYKFKDLKKYVLALE
jgi:hypothetical protein